MRLYFLLLGWLIMCTNSFSAQIEGVILKSPIYYAGETHAVPFGEKPPTKLFNEYSDIHIWVEKLEYINSKNNQKIDLNKYISAYTTAKLELKKFDEKTGDFMFELIPNNEVVFSGGVVKAYNLKLLKSPGNLLFDKKNLSLFVSGKIAHNPEGSIIIKYTNQDKNGIELVEGEFTNQIHLKFTKDIPVLLTLHDAT